MTRYVHDAGGVEAYLASVLPALASRGHDVAVWYEFAVPAGRRSSLPVTLPQRLLEEAHAAGEPGHPGGWKPDVVFLNGLSKPSVELQLTEGLPTVTFLHGYQGTCISGGKTRMFPAPSPCNRQLGPGCLVQYYPRRCGGLDPLVMIDSYRAQRQRQELLVRSTFVATFSAHMRDEAIGHGVDDARAIHLPPFNPAVSDTPAGHTDRQARSGPAIGGEAPARWHLAFVGRMEEAKGAHLFIDALGRLDRELRSRLRVTIAGDGRERTHLERAASRLAGVEITFPGWIAANDREQLFSTVDLLVVPSIWPEPLGLVGLEAAAAGVPALAFDVGGISDWLEDGVTGRLVASLPPSSRVLAEAIADALGDTNRLRSWGCQALERSRRYTLTAHVDALDAVFRRAAAIPR